MPPAYSPKVTQESSGASVVLSEWASAPALSPTRAPAQTEPASAETSPAAAKNPNSELPCFLSVSDIFFVLYQIMLNCQLSIGRNGRWPC